MYRRLFEVVPSPKCTLVKVNLSGANKVLQNRIIDKYDFVVLATRKMLPGDTESLQANGINYEDRVEADAAQLERIGLWQTMCCWSKPTKILC